MIKIKYSSITHDRGQWTNFHGWYNSEVKPGFDFISSAMDECHCPSCSSNSWSLPSAHKRNQTAVPSYTSPRDLWCFGFISTAFLWELYLLSYGFQASIFIVWIIHFFNFFNGKTENARELFENLLHQKNNNTCIFCYFETLILSQLEGRTAALWGYLCIPGPTAMTTVSSVRKWG